VDAGEPESRPAPAIAQIVYAVPTGLRLDALAALLDRRRDATGATLVFGRTKHGVKKLAKQLMARGYAVAALQGNMSQNARDRVVAEFRAGQVPILLATNVAARGLDVLSIEQVINYELPESAELFTHRVGRTGRMEREGEAITLLAPEDLPTWAKMQRDLGVRLPPRPWPQHEMPLPDTPAAPARTIGTAPAASAQATQRPVLPDSERRGDAGGRASRQQHPAHAARPQPPQQPQPPQPPQPRAIRETEGQPAQGRERTFDGPRRPRRRYYGAASRAAR
jgi:superfamily II DNA/RNA helicase